MTHFCDVYTTEVTRWQKAGCPANTGDFVSREIKWTSELEAHLKRGTQLHFDADSIVISHYRPFIKRFTYFAPVITHRPYQNFSLFPRGSENRAFCFAAEERSEFGVIAFVCVPNKDVFMPSAAQVLALYRYVDGNRIDNITDWSLTQFKKHYGTKTVTKEAIFHYVYAVLHDPIYREKYAPNLKREFPRIPFYADFAQWAKWGEVLMRLHIGYESVASAKLKRIDIPDEKARNAGVPPKAMLKADRDAGRIVLDSETTLTLIPPEAWDYRLGNRSALEWILDQYKEKKPKDPTIREKFDTYRFADYKERVIDLLQRVTTVSVETMKIVAAMKAVKR